MIGFTLAFFAGSLAVSSTALRFVEPSRVACWLLATRILLGYVVSLEFAGALAFLQESAFSFGCGRLCTIFFVGDLVVALFIGFALDLDGVLEGLALFPFLAAINLRKSENAPLFFGTGFFSSLIYSSASFQITQFESSYQYVPCKHVLLQWLRIQPPSLRRRLHLWINALLPLGSSCRSSNINGPLLKAARLVLECSSLLILAYQVKNI